MTATQAKPNELKLYRFFAAPVDVVWDAWTDPKQAVQWWGPRGFTFTLHSHDLRAGGHWHYTMHGPDGVDYVNKTRYLEVEKYKKMVYDHGGNDERKPLFRATVLFESAPGGTKMDMTMAFADPEEAKTIGSFIKKVGGDSTWDRFAEYLTKKSTGKDIFTINRSFNCSVETMYEMWTNSKHFVKWLAPTGFNMKFIKENLKPGGKSYFQMIGENGTNAMYGFVEYVKMEKPNFLLYRQQFADDKENISRHPFAPLWPETMQTSVQFTAEGPNRTRVTVTWEPYGKTTPEEVAAFVNARAGMTQGWTGSFDKLETLLAQG